VLPRVWAQVVLGVLPGVQPLVEPLVLARVLPLVLPLVLTLVLVLMLLLVLTSVLPLLLLVVLAPALLLPLALILRRPLRRLLALMTLMVVGALPGLLWSLGFLLVCRPPMACQRPFALRPEPAWPGGRGAGSAPEVHPRPTGTVLAHPPPGGQTLSS